MKTILIVGAGPNIGMSLARRFGREGYRVGLISRSQEKLNSYVSELAKLGIEALGFAADVHDRPKLLQGIEKIRSHFGSIDILEYSPLIDMSTLVNVLKLDVPLVQRELEFSILGAVAAVNAVLDGMIKKGDGAILFTLGATAYLPGPSHASGALGVVALKQYALNLSMALEPKGIYVGTLAIGQPPDSDEIADIYWKKVQERTSIETLYGDPRIHAAYEVLLTQGLGLVYPPKLTGSVPQPRNEKEKHTYLIGIYHSAECAVLMGETQEELDRHKELVKSIGGDPDAYHYGGDIDKVFSPVSLI